MAGGDTNASPSYKRRQALRDANTTAIQVLDSNPIDRYYETSLKLLSAFQQAVDERRLDQAYVYGVRFASFSIDSLPRHKHYKLQKNVRSKSRNLKQVDMVLKMMEVVTQRMDAEEMIKEKQRVERAAEEEKMKQVQQEQERKEQEEKERLKEDSEKLQVEKSAMAKLEALGKTLQKSSTKKQSPATAETKAPVTGTGPTKATAMPSTQEPISTVAKEKQPVSKTMIKKKATKKASNSTPETVNSSTMTAISRQSKASNATKLPSKTVQPRPKSPSPERKKKPLTKEERTIELLRQTISTQEKRLDHIEQVEIPALLKEAKNHLRLQKQINANQKETRQPQESSNESKHDQTMKEKYRRAALGCVARKKRLEQQMDVIKAAIFNMETQMFMLETALEDQHVQKAMKEASQAMKELQQNVGISANDLDLTDITASLQLPDGDLLEEEDLLEELEEWLSPQEASNSRRSNKFKSSAIIDDLADDDVSILSLPTVPDDELTARPVESKGSSSVQKLLKAVLG